MVFSSDSLLLLALSLNARPYHNWKLTYFVTKPLTKQLSQLCPVHIKQEAQHYGLIWFCVVWFGQTTLTCLPFIIYDYLRNASISANFDKISSVWYINHIYLGVWRRYKHYSTALYCVWLLSPYGCLRPPQAWLSTCRIGRRDRGWANHPGTAQPYTHSRCVGDLYNSHQSSCVLD